MEKLKKQFKLPSDFRALLKEIHNIIGEDRFILYGSTPVNLLLNKGSGSIYDLDIAVPSKNRNIIKKCREKIRRSGFKIIIPFRRYYIHKNKAIILIYAQNKKWFLDVAFLNNLNLIGHFNIETLMFRYPQMDCVDKYGTLKGIKFKIIKPIRDLDSENPLLLLGRFLRLCSKYNIPLNKRLHKKVLIILKEKIQKIKMSSDFYKQAYASFLSSFLKSIIQSTNKKYFIKFLIDLGIFQVLFPEFKEILDISKNKIIKDISRAKTKSQLVILLNKHLPISKRKLFQNKIKKLALRRWDKEDKKCASYFIN